MLQETNNFLDFIKPVTTFMMNISLFQTDTHYALLSLLLKLADTPTRHPVSEKTETQKEGW